MRDYGKIAPQFWTGETGKRLKASGPEAVVVALYLMTSPHANMIGLYYLPKLYIAHETGLGVEGASKGLARAIEAGFCTYDDASEHVFVHAMARFQISDGLDPKDKRCKGVANELDKCPKGALQNAFREIYSAAFNLPIPVKEEAPCKPLASQEQEQEQEQDKSLERQAARKSANRFAEFWLVYPVKKGKADAEKQWRAKGYDAIADTIIADVRERRASDRQWLDGYAPHGSTYVNGRGWEDEIEATRSGVAKPSAVHDFMAGAI